MWWTFGVHLQERILKYRDRVLADACYNEREKRWEMSPQGLKYAVDKELLESVKIRQDRGAMNFKVKGDDRIFFADLQVSCFILSPLHMSSIASFWVKSEYLIMYSVRDLTILSTFIYYAVYLTCVQTTLIFFLWKSEVLITYSEIKYSMNL